MLRLDSFGWILLVSQARYAYVLINFKGSPRRIRYKKLDLWERREVIHDVQLQVAEGDLSLGKGIRRLRTEALGVSQDVFAMICRISTRTLADIEADVGDPGMNLIGAVFRRFGIRLSLEMTNTIGNQEQLIKRLNRLGLHVVPIGSETI